MKDADIKKYIKQVAKEVGTDIKRQMGAYKEEMHGYVKTVAEQYLDIKKTLDSHTEQIGALLMDSTEIKSGLNKIQLDVSLDLDRKVDKNILLIWSYACVS